MEELFFFTCVFKIQTAVTLNSVSNEFLKWTYARRYLRFKTKNEIFEVIEYEHLPYSD